MYDPLGIHAEVERERLASRFRDRCSRERIHPIQYDINKLLDFIIQRRRRSAPAAFDAARRVLRVVDTTAIRLLVSVVLEQGRYGWSMRCRCERLLGYCDTLEAALALRDATDD
jgi:hypothetical protein